MDTAALNCLWGYLIIEELIRNGIDYFCISPGSRSTALTLAAAQNHQVKKMICFDERGAAFHALGYARGALKPAVLICTSGTAAANYYPAVIEANLDRLPMIIISADRPPELQQTGANQTIQQTNLFGEYVKWHFDLPCPDENIIPRMVLTTIDQLIYQACREPAGPVHLNCMFREPFVSGEFSAALPENVWENPYANSVSKWGKGSRPFTMQESNTALPLEKTVNRLKNVIDSTGKGLIFVGSLKRPDEKNAVLQLAQKVNWPLFPDITSGLRLGDTIPNQVHFFDQLLLAKKFWINSHYQPDTVLHIGGRFVSKHWLRFVEYHNPQNYIVIQDHPLRFDPFHSVTLRAECDISEFCRRLCEHSLPEANPDWLDFFIQYSRKVAKTLKAYSLPGLAVSEISAAALISNHIPPGHGLFLASSMPVRDMDMYAAANGTPVRVAANRGASGIDGTIAAAAGFAAGLNAPVTLFIGDLAFLHDVNSLSQLDTINQPLTIVVVNNRGGGIFSFLPIANYQKIFDPYFSTPHNYNFDSAAKMFGVHYMRPDTNASFRNAYRTALKNMRTSIIEIQTNREENKSQHMELQNRIIAELEGS